MNWTIIKNLSLLVLALLVGASCANNAPPIRTLIILDESGGAIKGAYEHPLPPFGNSRRSNWRGKLNVWTPYPVIAADGYDPALLDGGLNNVKEVILRPSKPEQSEYREAKLWEMSTKSRELASQLYHDIGNANQ